MGRQRERSVIRPSAALSMNERLFAETHARFQDWLAEVDKLLHGQDCLIEGQPVDPGKLLKATRTAANMACAMFSTRYGVGEKMSPSTGFQGYDQLYYHNTQHAIDLMERLDKIYLRYPEEFPPLRQVLLSLFAIFHDLRQQESDPPVNGVGANEFASAQEAAAILDISLLKAGFDSNEQPGLFSYFLEDMELMIHGTTFNFVSSTVEMANPFNGASELASWTVPIGALSTMICDQIKAAEPEWQESRRTLERVENILLAADVDTANVSDSFYDFALQGVNLCREIEKRKGNTILDPAAVYGFMTGGQEFYFKVAQKYNTRFCKEVFGADKARNQSKLEALTGFIRRRFGDPEDPKRLTSEDEGSQPLSGELILEAYLSEARRLT